MITIDKTHILSLILGVVLGATAAIVGLPTIGLAPKETSDSLALHRSDSESGLVSSSELQVVPKDSPKEPDLVVSQHLVADINGEKVSVPYVPPKVDPVDGQADLNSSPVGTQTHLRQTIDVAPILSKLTPNWEVGCGVVLHHSSIDGVVSIQRNYRYDRAIEVSTFLDKSNVNGVMVQHKWMF